MTPTINIQKEVQPHFKRIWQTDCPYILMCGGRNSFKSSTIALKLVMMMTSYIINDDVANVVVIRKVANTIADSVFQKIQWALRKFGIISQFNAKSHPYKIVHKRTGCAFHFYGQDDFQKLKSNDINNVIAVWYEEAAEFKDAEEFDQTNSTFIRQKHPKAKQVKFFWSWNPPRNPYEWINEWTEKQRGKKGWLVDKSSYLDDELGFVNDQMLIEINNIKESDYDYYRYLYLGEAVGLGTNIYNMNLFHPLDAFPDDEYLMNIYFSQDSGQQTSATTESCYGLTNTGKVILLNTYYYSPVGKVNKKAPSDFAEDLHKVEHEWIEQWGMEPWKKSADSATSDFALDHEMIKRYNERYHHVKKVDKMQMIDNVQHLLATGRFYYLDIPENQIFIKQHQKYQLDEKTVNTDNPKVIKVDDHTCDQFQYFVLDNLRDLDLKW